MKRCAQGAALATDTNVECRDEPVEPALRCSEILGRGARARRRPLWSRLLGAAAAAMGTTDLAYIGQVAPTIMFGLATLARGDPGP